MARHSTTDREPERLNNIPQGVERRLAEAVSRVLEEGVEPLRAAFLTRGLNALSRLTTEPGERELGEATAASTDYSVLLRALMHPEAIATIRQEDPAAEARLRGLA